MTRHTPGPWFAFIKDGIVAVGTGKSGKAIDRIVHWSGFDACGVNLAQQAANARLIATAPAMKELLIDLHPHVLALSVSDDDPEFKRLLARLEKLI